MLISTKRQRSHTSSYGQDGHLSALTFFCVVPHLRVFYTFFPNAVGVFISFSSFFLLFPPFLYSVSSHTHPPCRDRACPVRLFVYLLSHSSQLVSPSFGGGTGEAPPTHHSKISKIFPKKFVIIQNVLYFCRYLRRTAVFMPKQGWVRHNWKRRLLTLCL